MYKKRNLPPGPTPLPFIGNLLQIERGQMANSMIKLWKKYGDVYTLYFGSSPVIIICGYQAVKEALVDQGEEFGARGNLVTMNKFTQDYGIAFSNGERWRTMRNFTLRNLRSFGMGKKSTEEKIQEEAQYLVEEFKKSKGMPLNPSKNIIRAVSNVLCSIIFGNRFEYTDERFFKLLGIVEEIYRLTSSSWGQVRHKLQNIFPTLMDYIPGPHQKICSISEELNKFIYERVQKNQETLDPDSPRDFIDNFLIKLQEEQRDPASEFNMRNIMMTFYTLFLAGVETSTTVLKHSLLILVTYPEIQANVHKEIDQVIGRGRVPNYNDRAKMPYTEAVIHEILRFADIAPLNVPHLVTKDTNFRGFSIPKGIEVYPILCSVHRDPTQFANPYKFDPNHFLDENGSFKKNEAMMAFSAGKRICPGETLARMELFVFLTTILQNFTLTSQKKFSEADITPRMGGLINAPIRYEISFISRQ
ncbi:cytochrome P450 2G1-like [Spea bombifrons]|uniref:cytochrome P450 2G1-like n=1 Tax=Spea bombifrons TaxID=233779 RepID=UPI00234BE55C|nr:cytochrome P450 2G1-like [Spea bombifrons]